MSVTLNENTPQERKTYRMSFECGEHPISIEISPMALQTTATVSVRCQDTYVMVPLVAIDQASPEASFLPLAVHYQKRSYADGQIPGSRDRREGRPTELEVLTSRLIDRPLRATFPSGFYNEVQISPTVLSSDPNIRSDVLAMLGAATAVTLSGLPCVGPVASVRVGYINKNFVLNPTNTEMEQSSLDLVIAGTQTAILMVEAEAQNLPKTTIIDAVLFGHEKIKDMASKIDAFTKEIAHPKWAVAAETIDHALEQKVKEYIGEDLKTLHQIKDKASRKAQRDTLRKRIFATLSLGEAEINANQLDMLLARIESQFMREQILTQQRRLDGRESTTIRPIHIETSLLPRVHGSALFTRGETQTLVTTTLGSERDSQLVEGLDGITRRDTFMLHYNFPAYCVGEVGQVGSPKRREIGHGNLAKRAMRAVLPGEKECPYVIRIVSDVMGSNGSSSMATVCGASLALMDAGIKLKAPVAGIAMGLVKDQENFVVLSDISEDEDHIGDMDLKIAGTREGITALQMDIKTDGITREILSTALDQAHTGIQSILDKMDQAIAVPKKVSLYAPQILDLTIPIEKIQALIGRGGSTIRSITEETGTLIDIHRETGLIRVSGPDATACESATARIREVTETGTKIAIAVGTTYTGLVVKLLQSGAIVSLSPGVKGFVHISELVLENPDQSINDILHEKQRIKVKVLDIDTQNNRIKLTMKDVAMEQSEQPESPL